MRVSSVIAILLLLIGSSHATTITVGPTGCNYIHIQAAVNAAFSGDTINVAAGAYHETVNIDKSLTISGAGASSTIVDGNNLGSVITIRNVDVILSGLCITNGFEKYGAGVNNNGRTTIQNCSITKNSAASGGGIYNSGSITIINTIVSENSAKEVGGGIYNSGSITITNNTIVSKNSAVIGGGIYNSGTITTTNNTIVSENSATEGGGIWNYGDAIVTHSSIYKNSASNNGGGIYNARHSALSMSDSLIVRNSVVRWGGGIFNMGTAHLLDCSITRNSVDERGGGIMNWDWGTLELSTCTISYNSAGVDGGGIYNCNRSICNIGGNRRIYSNQATRGYGGGIYMENGSMMTFDGTQIAINHNNAHLPDIESTFFICMGWGVYAELPAYPVASNGFDYAKQITDNHRI